MSSVREPSWAEVWSFIADHPGGATLEQVAAVLGGVSRERIRQIERDALRRMKSRGVDVGLFVRTRDGIVVAPDFEFEHGTGVDEPECMGDE